MHSMLATLFVAIVAVLLNCDATNAQTPYVHQVIIANGGQFEFGGPPFADRATIGAYDPGTQQYTVFDTIEVEGVQGVVIDPLAPYAYLAAADSVIKYNLNTYQREAVAYFQGIKSISIEGNYVVVGKWFGGGDYVAVFDKSNLAPLFSIPEVTNTVYATVIVGDTLYAAHNAPGTIDYCPPYGCFDDTLGYIAVIDMNTQTFVRNIELDTAGAGVKKIYADGTTIYAICETTGNLATYNTLTQVTTFTSIGVHGGIGIDASLLRASFNGNVGVYDLSNYTFVQPALFSDTYVVGAYDNINDHYYMNKTDYSVYGTTYIHDGSGTIIDSIPVHVSNEGIAIDYRLSTGIAEIDKAFDFSLYPNPANDWLNVVFDGDDHYDLQVLDVAGKVVQYESSLQGRSRIEIVNLSRGWYVITLRAGGNVVAKPFVKH